MRSLALAASLLSVSAWAGDPLRAVLTETLHDARAEAQLLARLDATAKKLQARLSAVDRCAPEDVKRQLARLVAQNLEAKRAAKFPVSAERIGRQVIDYEAFRFETFVTTGVFAKRYFGYLDEAWDTAEYEKRLKTAARNAARACNRWLETSGASFRVTEQEIIVTFLAEGGAILLRENQSQLESIHPVHGVGLDDIASGFKDLEPLVRLVDRETKTELAGVVAEQDGKRFLQRNFKFEEAVAGTAVMWVWEKQIAERKLKNAGRAPLAGRSLDEQFVIGSLVYNSGILFEESTVTKLRDFDTGDYLFELSEKTKAKRWPLPVVTAKRALELILRGGDFPEQGTHWSAVLHVLQRYGAYAALSRYSDFFDAKGALK